MTVQTVGNGYKMTDEQLGKLTRRCDELKRRISEGTLCYDWTVDKLQKVIEGKIAGELRQWKVWKTITLGTDPKTTHEFRKAFKKEGIRIDDNVKSMLGAPAFAVLAKETKVSLVHVTVAELGFKGGAPFEIINDRAQEFGLDLCPNEVGPKLRLQYKDQPKGERLFVGMDPIILGDEPDDCPEVFLVEHEFDDLWLKSYYPYPSDWWDGICRFVFVHRK